MSTKRRVTSYERDKVMTVERPNTDLNDIFDQALKSAMAAEGESSRANALSQVAQAMADFRA